MALQIKNQSRFGYIPDRPDHRDYKLAKTAPSVLLPPVEPVNHMVRGFIARYPHAYDQENIGSCVANATGQEFQFVRNVAPRSRLQIYFEARRLQGWENEDTGCFIRDAMKVLAQLGAGRESWWPYDTTKFAVDPPLKVDRDALLRRIMTYYRLETRADFRRCLLEDYTFVAGITVYDYFVGAEAARFGIIPMPMPTEREQGGHAVLCIGYDDDFINSDWAKAAVAAGFPIHAVPKRVYIFRNSWGPWGHQGNFAIDADYIESNDLCGDCWTQRRYEVKTQ
jgi:hypothetical protein